MSVNASARIVQDGLVFYYDTGNEKSYAGEPTTNFYSNADLAGGNNVGQEGGSNATNEIVAFPNPGGSPFCVRATAVGGSIYTEYQLTVTGTIQANTTYCLSCWVAWTPDWDGTYSVFHMRWYDSGGGQAGASGLEQGTTVETRVVNGLTWYRKYYTFYSGASVNGTHDWYVGYYSNNTKGYRYFTNFQLEAKDHPTQFSRGARSNTAGLLDLTRRNTIDLSGAGFDSNANITFNQSSNYTIATNIPITSLPALSDFSLEIWFNPTAYPTAAPANQYNNTTRCGVLFGATYYCGTALYWYGNSSGNVFTIYSYIRGTDSYRTTAGYNLTLNKYHHLVLVHSYTAGKLRLYVNGTLYSEVQGATAQYDSNLTGTAGNIGVSKAQVDGGGEANYSHITGKVGEARIYTKALSLSEVLQNFNRSKSRYGL